MAQSPYFSGHGGVHSPNPPGAAQMLGQANASIAQGIMKLSDEIGSALKERGKKAKDEKKRADINKKVLKYAANLPENKGIVPGHDIQVDEIENLTNEEANNTMAAILGFQQVSGKATENRAAGARADLLGKDLGAYDDKRSEESNINVARSGLLEHELEEAPARRSDERELHQSRLDVAAATLDETKFDLNTKKSTMNAIADMSSIDFGGEDSADLFRTHFQDAMSRHEGADRSAALKAWNEMTKAAKGPWKPVGVNVPMPDGSVQQAVMVSPSSAQIVQKYAAAGKSFKKIMGEDGEPVAIGIPDGKGGFISSTIKHLKDDFRPSKFDLDNSGWLTGSELTDFKYKFSDGDAYKMMLFDMVFKPDPVKGLNIGKAPAGAPKPKPKGKPKPTATPAAAPASALPGTAAEVQKAFDRFKEANPD